MDTIRTDRRKQRQDKGSGQANERQRETETNRQAGRQRCKHTWIHAPIDYYVCCLNSIWGKGAPRNSEKSEKSSEGVRIITVICSDQVEETLTKMSKLNNTPQATCKQEHHTAGTIMPIAFRKEGQNQFQMPIANQKVSDW